MKWVGLTGSIATGKTTVAEIFKKNGYPVVDADLIAREVVAVGTEGFKKIVKSFGRTIVRDDGELDRKKLGDIVFANPEKRFELERITHPLVQARAAQLRNELESKNVKMAFYDVPLLYEKNLQDNFDAVVVVASSAQVQLERLMKRNNLSRSQAADRVSSQMSIAEKTAVADYVIWNDGAMRDLEFETAECLKRLKLAFGV